jgi:hypothetical protein
LLEVRDDTNEFTEPLEDEDEKLSIGAVIPLTIAMGMCGASAAFEGSSPPAPAVPGPSSHPRPPQPPRPSRDSSPAPPRPPSGE